MKTTPKIENLLCFSIYSAAHAMNQTYKPLLKEIGLTYPQYLVMVALWNDDNQSVGQLGALLFLESSTLTPLLKRLEKAGHVRRIRDKTDERKVFVSLTKQGKNMQKAAENIPSCISESAKLDETAATNLHAQINELRQSLLSANIDNAK